MIIFYVLVSLMPFLRPPFLSRVISAEVAFKVVGLVCVPYALYRLGSRGGLPPYFRTRQARLFVLLYAIAALSHLGNIMTLHLYSLYFLSLTSFLGLFFITLSIVDSLPRLRWVLFAANVGVALGSIRVVEEWRQTGARAGLMVGDSNYFATSAVLALPFAFLMVLHCKKRWERLCYGACLALSLIGVTLCESRGGTLALGVAFLYLVARSRRRVRNLMLIGGLVVPLMVFSPTSPLQRFLHPGADEESSNQAHLIAWKAGLRMIAAHPLAGVGLGNFKWVIRRFMDDADEQKREALWRQGVNAATIAHNTYLEVAAELGLPALAVFASILFFVYRSLERASKRARAVGSVFLYDAARGLQAGFVGFLVGGCTISAEYTKFLWLVVFLSMCLPQLLSFHRTPQHAKPASSLAHMQAWGNVSFR